MYTHTHRHIGVHKALVVLGITCSNSTFASLLYDS